jgi:transcriptional antiterminator NusG
MAEWYILHVHLGKEEKVEGILKKKLPSNLYRPFIPQKEKFFRRAGETSIVRAVCFPGYVFIESHTAVGEFMNAAERLIWSIKEVYSLLSYSGKKDITLTENDTELLRQLMGGGDCIKVSRVNIIDDVVKIDSGALVGKESLIIKVNRRKQIAEIEIKLIGGAQRIMVGLEILPNS